MIWTTPSTLQGARAMILEVDWSRSDLHGSLKRTTIYSLVMHNVPRFHRPFCEHAHGMRIEV